MPKENEMISYDWLPAAQFLASSYGDLQTEAEAIQNFLDHPIEYTEDMAIRDLIQVTARTDREAVQSSHISNQPESIMMKLEGGYVDRMNRRLRYEAANLSHQLVHIRWKIGVVDAALNGRTDNFHRQIFKRIFVRHRTYSSVRKAYKRQLYNRNIARAKKDILDAIEAELAMRACLPHEAYELEMLQRECRKNTCQGGVDRGDMRQDGGDTRLDGGDSVDTCQDNGDVGEERL